MAKSNEVAKMYTAMLTLKSWKEQVRVDVKMPNRRLFLLVLAVEEGLVSSDPGGLLREILTEEDRQGLDELLKELLAKGGLEEFYLECKKMVKG
jgi:hypothetical protein